MRNKQIIGAAFFLILALTFMVSGCRMDNTVAADQKEITLNTQELFTRIKVYDFAVIYENEFRYVKEDADLEEFLAHPIMDWYKTDTMKALQVDSVSVWGDSAYAHLQIEYLLSDSTLSVVPINLRWYRQEGVWIKPTMSIIEQQHEFDEEVRMYWEALAAKKEREAKKSKPQQENSGE